MIIQRKIGRYEVVSVLGKGAMGTVYKAVDPVIERTVAIKTISLDLTAKERAEFEERFYREAKSAGRLNHPAIVTIYDVGETDDAAYIAMEFLEGESLRQLLDSGVVLPISHICKIAARIANALDYAHRNQVVHRDIKPANIMIARNRDIKIMDFGIAKTSADSRTHDGTVLGSPRYMAPEQVVGKSTDGRTDIYALGAMLYEMLTGTAPFTGDDLNSIMYKILNEEPTPPSAVTSRVPPVFDRIVAKALAKRPEDRYQTAREFARDLKSCEGSAPRETTQLRSKAAKPTPKRSAIEVAQDATVLLAPRESRSVAAPGKRTEERIASGWKNLPPRRKLLLAAGPALLLVVFAIVMQLRQPQEMETPAPIANVTAQESAQSPPPAAPADVTAAPVTAAPGTAPPVTGAPVTTVPVVAPVPEIPRAIATRATAAPVKATLFLAVAPWGRVYVDGRSIGVSPPLKRLKLTPGIHTVEIRNQAFAPYRNTVKLASGESLKIKHKFD